VKIAVHIFRKLSICRAHICRLVQRTPLSPNSNLRLQRIISPTISLPPPPTKCLTTSLPRHLRCVLRLVAYLRLRHNYKPRATILRALLKCLPARNNCARSSGKPPYAQAQQPSNALPIPYRNISTHNHQHALDRQALHPHTKPEVSLCAHQQANGHASTHRTRSAQFEHSHPLPLRNLHPKQVLLYHPRSKKKSTLSSRK
jgi:hypothetical protein